MVVVRSEHDILILQSASFDEAHHVAVVRTFGLERHEKVPVPERLQAALTVAGRDEVAGFDGSFRRSATALQLFRSQVTNIISEPFFAALGACVHGPEQERQEQEQG